MTMIEIINHKRDGKELSKDEIQFWIDGISDNSIPDYQSSSLLMAIVLNGMNNEETTFLTAAMRASGDVFDLSQIEGIKVDKHSTGGVGDKTSIVLGPLVASCGVKVAKMSGRGLGHTGGTLDKLESIEGFHVELSEEEFIEQVNKIGLGIIGQTKNLVPADKALYALRDVTGTVASVPLIASSVMSKKLAAGSDCILLDVKFGDGAFMPDVDHARELAEVMIAIGEGMGKKVNAMLSNMNQPLGRTIGNALEIREAVETLLNKGPEDFTSLCVEAAAYMLLQAERVATVEEGRLLAQKQLANQEAYQVFLQWIQAQGGNTAVLADLEAFTEATYQHDILALEDGYVWELKAMQLGVVAMHLGAGRQKKEDVLDMKAGIILQVKDGDKVKRGDVLAHLQSNTPIRQEVIESAQSAFIIKMEKPSPTKLIEDVL